MTGWSSKPEWPSVTGTEKAQTAHPEHPIATLIRETGEALIAAIPNVYNNKMPTHDPYTNPNAQVYYECKCGAILDPGTKSFASLNNAASDKGWKVRWKPNGE